MSSYLCMTPELQTGDQQRGVAGWEGSPFRRPCLKLKCHCDGIGEERRGVGDGVGWSEEAEVIAGWLMGIGPANALQISWIPARRRGLQTNRT